MKIKYFFILYGCMFFLTHTVYAGMNGKRPGRYEIDYSANGWVNPIDPADGDDGKIKTSTYFDYFSANYPINNKGLSHLGDDIIVESVNKGTREVFAIAQGTVVYIDRDDLDDETNMSVVYLKHKTISGNEFVAVYGHCYATDSLYDSYSSGDDESTVDKGEHICDVRTYQSPDHLHFGINLDIDLKEDNSWGASYITKKDARKKGWVNPYYFLRLNRPANKYVSIPFRNVWGVISWYPVNNSCFDAWTVLYKGETLLRGSEKEAACEEAYEWLEDNGYFPDHDLFFGEDDQIGSCRIK